MFPPACIPRDTSLALRHGIFTNVPVWGTHVRRTEKNKNKMGKSAFKTKRDGAESDDLGVWAAV